MAVDIKLWKPILGLFIISATISCPNTAFAQLAKLLGADPDVEVIDTATLSKMLTQRAKENSKASSPSINTNQPQFVLVDVRSDAEVDVSVIPGAITKAEYEQNAKQYVGQLVIPYCTVGGRSGAYAKHLAKKGVNVRNYKGSILDWIAAGLPLSTREGKPTNRVHTLNGSYRVPDKYEQVSN